jgi:Spy/CpxP family protein refolding chaperone
MIVRKTEKQKRKIKLIIDALSKSLNGPIISKRAATKAIIEKNPFLSKEKLGFVREVDTKLLELSSS